MIIRPSIFSIVSSITLILLPSSVFGGAEEGAQKFKEPSFLIGKVNGKQVSLHILPKNSSPLKRKFKGTRFINVEPGCIMLEAYVRQIEKNKLEIRMPGKDWFTAQTMKKMGVNTKLALVIFEPSKQKNKAGSILTISSPETNMTFT